MNQRRLEEARARVERTYRAYHEAGHAVAALLMGWPFRHVSTRYGRGENSLGIRLARRPPRYVREAAGGPPDGRALGWMQRYAVVTLAGPAAEARHAGYTDLFGPDLDDARCMLLAGDVLSWRPELRDAWLAYVESAVAAMIDDPATWARVEAVARALVDRGRLDEEEVRRICEASGPDPAPSPPPA